MNSVNLVGRLARDPDLRYTPNGTAVCSFVVAVRNPFKQDADGNYEADFINCVVWQKAAEMLAETHRKGDQVAVSGRIQTRHYDKEDTGERVYVTEVNVENVHFIKPKEQQETEPANGNRAQNGNRNQNVNRNQNGNRNRGNRNAR